MAVKRHIWTNGLKGLKITDVKTDTKQ